MFSSLYRRIAQNNLQKNYRYYVPRILTEAGLVACFYIMSALALEPKMKNIYGGEYLPTFMMLGTFILAILSVVLLMYTANFLMKQRMQEYGLYYALGMEKKHVARVLCYESGISSAAGIGIGIGSGILFYKLSLLILTKMMGTETIPKVSLILPAALGGTVLFFAAADIMTYLANRIRLSRMNTTELLHSREAGEREPKTKILLLIAGIAALAAGYYIALTTDRPLDALNLFFIAAFLVISGTYLLFGAGSIFILKCMKKNPKFYYKTKNFISVSNLMFRMKHNAAGLASICVLSTGVILLLTCGFSLMMLIGKNIDDRYPTDIKVAETVSEAGKGMDDFVTMNKALQQDGIVTTDQIYRQYRNIMVTEKDGKQKIADPDTFDSDIASDIVTYLLSAADYNEYADMNLTLKDDEILIYSSGKEWKKGDNLNFMGKEYTVAGEAEYSAIRYIIDSTMSIFEREILVFPDDEQICALMAEAGQRVNPDEYEVFIGYQLEKALTAEQMETVRVLMELSGLNREAIRFKSEEMSAFYSIYGGIFFVGMFLAALFLMATVMIIYYKQMSEGYEDQKRFQILSNVGLTEKEAKESIRTQVMLLFYLPVAAAIMHMIVASSVVRLFLRMILIVDTFTFNMAIAIVSMIFLVIYTIVYKITSREYYKIVNRKD